MPHPLPLDHAPDAAQLASRLADAVAERIREGLAARGAALLIVSGGSTPVPFFEALATRPLDWPRVTVTLADERWLPPSHADSNERLVRQHLLQGPAARARFVPLYRDQTDLDEGCVMLEAELATLPWPADAVVLGMGGDGHTASLFPHAPELPAALSDDPDAARCVPVSAPAAPNVPVPRVSLTRRALLDARWLAVHVTGQGKLALIQQAWQPGPVAPWPIRLALHQDRVPCRIFHAD